MSECATPGCPQHLVATSPFCYWHTKVREGIITDYWDHVLRKMKGAKHYA